VGIDGQRSVYVPIFKQGDDSNTITIVDGIKAAIKHLVDIPASLKTAVVFDQSIFVKLAIKNLVKEASIGLVLTGNAQYQYRLALATIAYQTGATP
jgi:multidrug efflux pump subunit AcrB